MSLFKKLMLMRQLRFEEGNITLLNRRMIFFPLELSISFTKFLLDNPNTIPRIYEGVRSEIGDGWASAVKKIYRFKDKNFIETLKDISNLSGWGKSEFVAYDINKLEGIIRSYDQPVGLHFKGKTTVVADHIWRALGAGCGSAIMEEPMDWIETKCIAKGDPFCEMHFKMRKNLTKEEKIKFKAQLP